MTYTYSMDRRASRALMTIRACIAARRYIVLRHFIDRMDQRGLVWPDILAVVDTPGRVRDGGKDRFGRPKWILSGTAADGEPIEFVAALDHDERGRVTVFITIY